MSSGRSKCWRNGRGRGRHILSMRRNNSAEPSVWANQPGDCAALSKQNTIMRSAIPVAKRLAIILDWAGSGSPHQTLSRTYDVSKAAVCNINLEVVFILCQKWLLAKDCQPSSPQPGGLPPHSLTYAALCCWTQEPLSPEYLLPVPLALYLCPFFL